MSVKAGIPLTFAKEVLNNYSKKFEEIRTSEEYGNIFTLNHRIKYDELLGEVEAAIKPIIQNVREIYGDEATRFFQEKLLDHHFKLRGNFPQDVIKLYIAPDWSMEEFESLRGKLEREQKFSKLLV